MRHPDPESILQVAKRYGIHEGVLRKAVKQGKVAAHERFPGRRNAGLVVDIADVERWLATKRECVPWSDADVAALVELAPTCTWEQVGAYLGRSAGTCKEKARQLRGGGFEIAKLPGALLHVPFVVPASAILLARTCPGCGYLRDASQFSFGNGKRRANYYTRCRHCNTETFKKSDRYRAYHENRELLDEITRQQATNLGQQYTSSDDAVVRDTSLSEFEIALKIGRTYSGVRYRRSVLGVRTGPERQRVADHKQRWHIEFPNAARALHEHFQRLGQPVPEELWEWSDDDLAVSA